MEATTKTRFLEALSRCRAVDPACRKVGWGRSSAYRARNTDPAFAAAWAEALGQPQPAAQQFPPRIEVELLTPEQRRLARAFLASLEAEPPGSTQERAKQALDAWLEGKGWQQLTENQVAELRRMSVRAHADYLATFPLPAVLGHPENEARDAADDGSMRQLG